ncbi:MAG: SpoIIE family protein phosphatase [Terracidiphilus sp.]
MRRNIPHLLAAVSLALLAVAAFSAPKKRPPAPPAPLPPAQLITLGDSAIPLTGPWKFSPGDSPWPADASSDDSPIWAQPDFDDSSWTSVDLSPPPGSFDTAMNTPGYLPGWTAQGFPNLSGYAWYRLRFRITDTQQPLSLKMPADFEDSYQVYANGQYVGQFGQFDSTPPTSFFSRPVVFSLPPPAPNGEFELAVRFYMSPATSMSAPVAGGMHSPPVLGLPFTLQLIESAEKANFAYGRFGFLPAALLFLLLAPATLWFWLRDRREGTFLWLALALASSLLFVAVSALSYATFWLSQGAAVFGLNVVLDPIWLPLWIMVWWHWFGLEQKRWIPLAAWIMAAANIFVEFCALSSSGILGFSSLMARQWLNHVSLFLLLATCILLLVVLAEGFRRDRAEALPAAVPIVLLEIAAFFIYISPLLNIPYPGLHLFGLFIDAGSGSNILMALVLSVLVLRRHLRAQVALELARQSIELDLEQARELQQHVLIPEEIHSPSFTVEAQYHPAQTVGGDFFQTVLGIDGSLLILVGDVSGKGISAAMLVAVIVGAARTRAGDSLDPASLLAVLNQRLIGRSGGHFATCLAAELSPGGRLRVANAGHLAPYLNGAELALSGSLPLGLAVKLEPSVQVFQLRPGDRLTFMTDGVAEARNPEGELFGFDRVRIICNEPVEEIVRRAQKFGQNDDITVLRVDYTGGRSDALAANRS